MRINTWIAGIVAATLIGGSAMAQSRETPNKPETSPEAGTPEADSNANKADGGDKDATKAPPADADAAARATHLDELLRRLADPDAKDWQRVQAQVIQAWNRSGSPSMDLLAQRADKALEKKDYATALIHLNDLVRLAPDFAEGWNKRATIHFLKQDYGPSLEDIARVLKLEPRHFGALSGLGIILDRIGDPKGALEAYRRAIAINPHLPGIKDGIKKLEKQVEGERL